MTGVLFSEFFRIRYSRASPWFNPIVGHDTRLFIDPFLVDKIGSKMAGFKKSHVQVIGFFNHIFEKAAKLTTRSQENVRPLLHALTFPEVDELCLGYSKASSHGLGSGGHFSNLLLAAIFEMIDEGITSVSRFEELALFKEGFGADRIGDMIGNLLRLPLARYTERICRRCGVKTTKVPLRHAIYDKDSLTWNDEQVRLPIVPFADGTRRPVILIPKVFLRPLPTVSIEGFWDYCYSNENDTIRQQFGEKVKKGIDRNRIFRFARSAKAMKAKYLASLDKAKPDLYDIDKDPQLLHKWYEYSQRAASARPLAIPQATNALGLKRAVDLMIGDFKAFIELRGGWRLLNDEKNKPGRAEKSAQLLFHGMVLARCRTNDIDCSPETQTGAGLIDFKFSTGYHRRALVEVKLARNSKLLHGLTVQTPANARAEHLKWATVVVVVYTDADMQPLARAREEVAKMNKSKSVFIDIVDIDARKKASASKLHHKRGGRIPPKKASHRRQGRD